MIVSIIEINPKMESSIKIDMQNSLLKTTLNIEGYNHDTKNKSLNNELVFELRKAFSPKFRMYRNWRLIYSTEQDGISMNTLYNKCSKSVVLKEKFRTRIEPNDLLNNLMQHLDNETDEFLSFPCILLIENEKKMKFGCFLNENLRCRKKKLYYGNGECFLWKFMGSEDFSMLPSSTGNDEDKKLTTENSKKLPDSDFYPHFKAFFYTGINDNIIFSNNEFIAIGSSEGKNGLWIDKSLNHGYSYHCLTFENEILCELETSKNSAKFVIKNLEVWRISY